MRVSAKLVLNYEDEAITAIRGIQREGRTSLAVQWLRPRASTAGGAGSIPGWGTKIPHAKRCSQKKKKNRERERDETKVSNRTLGRLLGRDPQSMVKDQGGSNLPNAKRASTRICSCLCHPDYQSATSTTTFSPLAPPQQGSAVTGRTWGLEEEGKADLT